MEKRAGLHPLELRRTFKVFTLTKMIGNYLVIRSTTSWVLRPKTWLKRQNLNHLARDLTGNTWRHFGSTDQWEKTYSVVETGTREISEPPSFWRYLVCSLLNNRFQHNRWPWLWRCLRRNTRRLIGYIYTDSSVEDAARNGGSGVFVRTLTGQTVHYANLNVFYQ